MLGQIDAQPGGRLVVADMEAGAGTLTRMAQGSVDVALLVVEPSAKSIDVARRAASIIAARGIGKVVVVANRIRDDADLDLIRSKLADFQVVSVPEDPLVCLADREARSPLDMRVDSPAVSAVARLASDLVGWADSSSTTPPSEK